MWGCVAPASLPAGLGCWSPSAAGFTGLPRRLCLLAMTGGWLARWLCRQCVRTRSAVGWAKRSVPNMLSRHRLLGTLRFAQPTFEGSLARDDGGGAGTVDLPSLRA